MGGDHGGLCMQCDQCGARLVGLSRYAVKAIAEAVEKGWTVDPRSPIGRMDDQARDTGHDLCPACSP